jgi:MFS family permease
LIVFFVSYWQINDEYQVLELNKNNRYSFRVFKTATVFLCTFLLSILVGNYFKRVDYRIDSQWNSYAGVTTKKDSVNVAESLSFFEKVIQQKHNFETNTQKLSKTQTNDTGKRVGYVLLFMLSLILTYFGAVLSCSLACSSYGFFAILAFLLTLGILSGGFYFLIKSFRKTIKTSKEMTHEEKKKERKKFFTIWGVVTAIIALLIVIANA